MRRSGIIGGLVAAACGVVIWMLVQRHRDRETTKPRPTAVAPAPVAPAPEAEAPAPAPVAEAPAQPDKPAVRRIDEATRGEILKQLARAKRARESGKAAPAASGTSSTTPAPLPGELSTDQVLDGFLAVMPLLKECYTEGLERGAVTRGTIKVDMKMRGEPEIGTLITQADLSGDAAFLKDKELSTCLHETMMSIELPPMSEGAELRVQTTMKFADEPGQVGPEK